MSLPMFPHGRLYLYNDLLYALIQTQRGAWNRCPRRFLRK